jgi:hypothetical protein
VNNYIASAPNPFNLATPPPGFLAHMYAYDAQLVIFPSSKEAVYRLCRRTIGAPAPLTYMKGHPDAATCRKHRLAPVKAILPAPIGHFGPHILNDLASYDIQRAGGGSAAADRLDELDERERQAIDADIDDEGHALGREAYRQIKMATGQTVFSGVKNPEGAGAYGHREKLLRPQKPRKIYRPRNRFGDSTDGAIFTGR